MTIPAGDHDYLSIYKDAISILHQLRRYLTLQQIELVKSFDLEMIVHKPHGPDIRLFLSHYFVDVPDIQIPLHLWESWRLLGREALSQGRTQVFLDQELHSLRSDFGLCLAEVEPNNRFYGFREDAVELWTGASAFADRIDACCAEAIDFCHVNAECGLWREDAITGFILQKIKENCAERKVQLASGKLIDFSFAAHKRRVPIEESRGDVTFVFVRDDGDGAEFIGVSYMESKKRDDSDNFSSIKVNQLLRILLGVPNALLALYEIDSKYYRDCVHKTAEGGRVAVLPMIQVSQGSSNINAMARFSTTLGHQFAVRFMNGADLSLSPDLAGSVLGATTSEYLVIIGVGRKRPLEIVAKNEAIKRKLQAYQDLQVTIDSMLQRVRDRDSHSR